MAWRALVSRAFQCAMFACGACWVLAVSAQVQRSTPPVASTGKEDSVPVDLYQQPRSKTLTLPDCERLLTQDSETCDLLDHGTQGWVELGFMVDPGGKPTEVYTVSSKHGSCAIELDGAPGTTFELVQF